MSNYTLSPAPFLKFTLLDGITPAVAGQLYTYVAGTNTPATTYSASSGTPNSNPITLDGQGRAVVFLAPGSYRFVAFAAVADGGAQIFEQDNISAIDSSSSAFTFAGIVGSTVADGACCYLSAGDGSLTAGRWYAAKADNAYSSLTPIIAFCIGGGITGAIAAFSLGGPVTSGLAVTVGVDYYISSASAGVITSTAPLNMRFVGRADSGTSLIAYPNPPQQLPNNGICDFRLTLTTGVPITSTDVTAATTLYCTPYLGNRIALYNANGDVTIVRSVEFSIVVPTTTSQIYDVFCYNNAGVPTLELLAWTNDTTRATALVLTTTGTYTKTGDLTRRYLGSFRTTTVAGQTEDSLTKRYVWNYYNRAKRPLRVRITTASWTYASATIRQANATATNQVDIVVGIVEETLSIRVGVTADNSSSLQFAVGIGEDVTNAMSSDSINAFGQPSSGLPQYAQAMLDKMPAVGRHFYPWLESSLSGTSIFYSGAGILTGLSAGISGFWAS